MKAIPIILLCLIAPVPGEIARWADDRIPLTDGLALWFDATRENEAREAHYMNRLADGQAMDFWHDSSGNSRHLAQWSAAFRPRWSGGAAQFAGDDFLAALLVPGLESRACTMFVVASPDGAAGDFPALFSSAGREGDDFTGGLTLDFGREAGRGELAEIFNVEGAGQSGERNLLAKPLPADRGHLFTVTSAAGESRLRVDAENHGRRERGEWPSR